MRGAAIAMAIGIIGCGGSGINPRALPAIEPIGLISAQTYTDKTAGLRATLARSDVGFDSVPVIRSCYGFADRYCLRCEVATREDTRGIDPEMIDGVAIAFARYPTSVLAAGKLEHVALCRSIRYDDKRDGAPAGVAISSEHRLLISIEGFVDRPHDVYDYFTIEQVVHHELFHLIDRETFGATAESDTEWLALNPSGFEYRDPAESSSERRRGFVNTYATTSQVEDRASVFEYLMGQPEKLCTIAEADPVVAAKTAVIWKRMATIVGEELLQRHAACVGWIETKAAGTAQLPKQLGPQPAGQPQRGEQSPTLPRKRTILGKMR
ncbi:MAG: hypothetical protein ABI867_41100 [Kofleriaceae bacterium]